jgi:RNA 3'-phosphate cyclase
MAVPVEVDGGMGEGGGQVLRIAVAMAAATGRDLRVQNIRAGRERPGLRPQHVASIRAVAGLCDAQTAGVEKGGREVMFEPRGPPRGSLEVDVGTAGAVTLVLQAALVALSAPGAGPGELHVTGGTDVIMAPSWDYLAHVLVPILGRVGLDMDMECERRGFHPKGGGHVSVRTEAQDRPLGPFVPKATREPRLEGTIVWSHLPDHIPRRIDHAIRKELVGFDIERIRKKHVEADSPGVVATLWADMGGAVLGTSMVGRRGLPSERIGSELGRELKEDIEAGATVDRYQADQLVAHAALAEGGSEMRTRQLTAHAKTALEVAGRFVPLRVKTEEDGPLSVVRVGRSS